MMSLRPEVLWPQMLVSDKNKMGGANKIGISCSALRILTVPCILGVMVVAWLLIRGGL